MSNTMKTWLLLAALTAMVVAAGNAIGGRTGLMFAVGFAVVGNFVTYWFSDKIVLAMHGAKPVSAADAPELVAMVSRLARAANIPAPKVYLVNDASPNAFATGRNPANGAVAFNTGLLNLLTPEQVEGVAAHEIAHIANRDTLIMVVASTLVGVITGLADMLRWSMFFFGAHRSDDEEEGGGLGGIVGQMAFVILAPLAAVLLQMAVSRSREYIADRTAARITGKPWALADALERLHMGAEAIPSRYATAANASLYIANPLTAGGVMSLFSTHPPMAERVRLLRTMRPGQN